MQVNVSGTWRKGSEVWANVSGTWRKATEVWVNVNGTWRKDSELGIAIDGTHSVDTWNRYSYGGGRYRYTQNSVYIPSTSIIRRLTFYTAQQTAGRYVFSLSVAPATVAEAQQIQAAFNSGGMTILVFTGSASTRLRSTNTRVTVIGTNVIFTQISDRTPPASTVYVMANSAYNSSSEVNFRFDS